MTNLAFADTDLEVEFHIRRDGGGKVSCARTVGTTVVKLDRSQERALPAGAQLLDDFLADFEAEPEVAKHLPAARQSFAKEIAAAGAPLSIRQLRLAQGLSQAELAEQVGTSQAAISSIEARTRKPGEDTLRGLANALRVDFNTLMAALANG